MAPRKNHRIGNSERFSYSVTKHMLVVKRLARSFLVHGIASSNPTAFFMSETVVQIHLGSAYLDQAIMSPSVST